MRRTTGPFAARKLIGRQLRRLRDSYGESQAKAARVIGRSVDTLQRIERGESSVGRSDIIVLCAQYAAPPEIHQGLLQLQELQRAKAWWEGFSPGEDLTLIIELESSASLVEQYDHFFVPAVLQTDAYAEAVAGVFSPDTANFVQSKLRAARAERLFSGDDPPQVSLVVDETVLRRRVGDAHVMRDQLKQLLQPPAGCELRVIPFDAGAHPGVVSFVVFGFEEEFLPPVAHVDGGLGGRVLFDEDEDAHGLRLTFARLRKLALSPTKSRELIASIAEEW